MFLFGFVVLGFDVWELWVRFVIIGWCDGAAKNLFKRPSVIFSLVVV